jgi:hypothetical protein
MGATLRFDLGSIDPADPRALISLLSKVSAQRASWMMAGAFFRRLGHPSSALEVVSAMVEGAQTNPAIFLSSAQGSHVPALYAVFPLTLSCLILQP